MKTEKEIKEEIIDKILEKYEKIKTTYNYKNFGKHKTKTLKDFIEYIEKNKEKIYNLTNNNFHIKIKNEIDTILMKIKTEYKYKQFPSLLNFDIQLNQSLKMKINEKEYKIQQNNIKLDINKMLEKYFDNKYDLKQVDKFIKTLSKSISITNEKYNQIESFIIKQIRQINSPYTMSKNFTIQNLATELEEHLNPTNKIPPIDLNNQPTNPEM